MNIQEKYKELNNMQRVQSIYTDPLFINNLKIIESAEKDRIYCRHGFDHLIDTARLAYILMLERKLEIKKEFIYSAALLHDIGRAAEYTDGIPHDEAGKRIAREILSRCGFTEEEAVFISEAIKGHRSAGEKTPLGDILYEADKLSRQCYRCKASDTCKWSDEKKNHGIIL